MAAFVVVVLPSSRFDDGGLLNAISSFSR
jgi:hypothetical protein